MPRGRGAGKNFRGGYRGRNRGGSGGVGRRDDRFKFNRSDVKRESEILESYYNELGIVTEDEREQFWKYLRSDLPNSFRFTGSKGHALVVQKRLVDQYIPEITSVEFEGQPVTPPTPVEWYPDKLAWSMTTPKNVIRKFPPFASFQKFLVSETSIGNISRQEVVSMIPPLVMDIKPGMTVLDLCAAPGSKSAQLIEMLHGGEEARVRKILEIEAKELGRELSPSGIEVDAEKDQASSEDDYKDDGRPTGVLVANDSDYRRAQMLVHQTKRLNSPNVIVVNHDATLFPSIRMPSELGKKYLKFDRILADVPCSGDGTLRKNPEIWKEWTQSKSLGLHLQQVRILVRALQMLKVGGRVVYSTCSMNPTEDEAVVASAIDRCGGTDKVKIVSKDDALPGLRRKPGLKSWRVRDKSGQWWDSWTEVEQAQQDQGSEESVTRLVDGMFPPKLDSDIALEHCMRIYPHLQDTGGFFISVLEKQKEIKARPENAPKVVEPPATTSVTAIADEIKDKPQDSEILDKVDAIDAVNPPQANGGPEEHAGNLSAAARQNDLSRKRSHDDIDVEPSTNTSKKPKILNDEPEPPKPAEVEDRKVHYPPPPGADVDLTTEEPAPTALTSSTIGQSPSSSGLPQSDKRRQIQEESFIYLDPQNPELQSVFDFYTISPRFPRERFLVRNPTGIPHKSIYYTSSLVKSILEQNEGKGIKFVHSGVKMFVKQDVQNAPDACKWRIQSEGLPIIESWVGEKRVVRCFKRKILRRLLVEMFPKLSAETVEELGEVGKQTLGLGVGCCILRVEPRKTGEDNSEGDRDEGFDEKLVMPLWRGAASLNLMLPKDERKALLLRLYNEEVPLVDHSKDKVTTQAMQGKDEHPKQFREEHWIPRQVSKEHKNPNGEKAPTRQGERNSSSEEAEALLGGGSSDEEDGGVKLENHMEIDTGTIKVEDKIEALDNAEEAERDHEKGKVVEVAPGVTDEDDQFNKTV